MERQNSEFKVYLGDTKGHYKERVYLNGFTWDCGWYWGGGYISTRTMHTHFDGYFLDPIDERGHSLGTFVSPGNEKSKDKDYKVVSNGYSVWEDLSFFLDNPQFTENEWWRIKDLYKQFYSLQKAAETFQYGGHCISKGRSEKEINKEMAEKINDHIQAVIIPEIRKALKLK